MKKSGLIGLFFVVLNLLVIQRASSQSCTANFVYTTQANGVVTFSSNSTLASTNTIYNWSVQGGPTYTAFITPTINITFTNNGTYTITLQITSFTPACTSNITQTILINNICNISAGFSITQGTNGLVNFINTSTGTNVATSYTLNFGNALTSSLATTAHTYSANGNYVATLVASNGPTCSSTFTMLIPVQSYCNLTASMTVGQSSLGTTFFSNASSGTVAGTTYTLSFGNGNTSTVIPANQNFTLNGIYIATLQASNNFTPACVSVYTVSFIINHNCNLSASYVYTTNLNGSVSFSSTSTGTNASTSYTWDYGDLSPLGSGPVNTHSYSNNGSYSVKMIAYSNNSITPNCSDTVSSVVTVTNVCNLSANFTYNRSGNATQFINLSSGTSSTTIYSWSFGDGGLSFNPSPSHTYSAQGSYIATLTISDSFNPGCTSTKTIVVVPCFINSAFSFTQGILGIVSFSSLPSNANYFSWYFGDGNTSLQSLPTHTYLATGTYTVKLIVKDTLSNGCRDSSTQVINVNLSPCNVNAAFQHTVFANGLVNFNSTSTGFIGGTYKQRWDFGDGFYTLGSSTNHQYINGGLYYVKFLIYDSINVSCRDSIIQAINITGIPCNANANFTLIPTMTPHYWVATPFYPWNVINAVWNWGDGTSTNGLYVSHTYSVLSTYSICLSVTVSCGGGATATYCSPYVVSKSGDAGSEMIYVNVFPPGDKYVGVPDESTNEVSVKVYPNPNNGNFKIRIDDIISQNLAIEVFDLVGRKVWMTDFEFVSGKDVALDNISIPQGVYLLKVTGHSINSVQRILISE